jgi:hypothetical protein
MSRYLQEQSGWLLAVLPARVAQQALVRFGWPAVAASQIREHGEALGAELEQQMHAQLTLAQQEAAGEASRLTPVRQPPVESRLYAAPDGVMYCTTERGPQTGKARWRELKVAAVYEGRPADDWDQAQNQSETRAEAVAHEPVRTRLVRWLRTQEPAKPVAAPDQASLVSYVAETGPWEQFGSRLWAELWARGMGRLVQDVVVVADGSEHIEQVVDSELRLPGIHLTRILDIAHAQEHLWAVSTAAFGEGSAAGRAWVQVPLTALERGQVETVLSALEALALEREQTAPVVAELARKTAAYLAKRREQVDYPQLVGQGSRLVVAWRRVPASALAPTA